MIFEFHCMPLMALQHCVSKASSHLITPATVWGSWATLCKLLAVPTANEVKEGERPPE